MKKILAGLVVLALPATVGATPFVPVVGTTGSGWHSMGPVVNDGAVTDAPNGTRDQHYWMGYSFDRKPGEPTSSTTCGAGALLLGYQCPWSLGVDNDNGLTDAIGSAVTGQELFYWGMTPNTGGDPNFNADTNFYFQGPMDVDLRVLSEITAWKEGVEIGYYDVDNPSNMTPLLGAGGGMTAGPDGKYDLGGTTTVTLNGKFGFYYRNHTMGVVYFTESYLNAFFGGGSPFYLANGFPTITTFDDEFFTTGFNPALYQQWALFGQGNKFWLGLEDIFGPTTPCVLDKVPCSDYDYNDFIIGGTVAPVPEPTTLTMLALGFFGAALALKRRNREQ